MQEEFGKLKIHTNLRPEETARKPEDTAADEENAVRWESIPHPLNRKRGRKLAKRRAAPTKRREREQEEKLTSGEKMVRNTALACALLLSVLALKNVDQPWSKQAVDGVRQAMTMRVDWDNTLGKLSFVRALVPDTALVFLNLGNEEVLNRPVAGEVSHEYDEQQPWLEYRCAASQSVCAAAGGTVKAAGQGVSGDWTVLIGHENGMETVYGYLAEVSVQVGQQVEAGQEIGVTAENEENSRLYFEVCEDGASVDPSGRMR